MDCAFFSINSVKGIGLCFKDQTGQFIFTSTAWSASKVTVKKAEALRILKALHIAHSMSIPQVRFESDSNCAVNAINSSIMPNELGAIVSKCRLILSENTDYKVVFVRRQFNKVAHSLARASLS